VDDVQFRSQLTHPVSLWGCESYLATFVQFGKLPVI
jgi:hypothetical protein